MPTITKISIALVLDCTQFASELLASLSNENTLLANAAVGANLWAGVMA